MTPKVERPAVGTILALASTEISARKEPCTDQHKQNDRYGDQSATGEEGSKAAPAEDGEPKIGKTPHCAGE
jgi:hypothetical protein